MMDCKRPLQHLVIVVYIASTLAGMSYALFRYTVPGVPRFFKQWSYGMMAPYQTYRVINEELVAEGRRGKTWERIDLGQYLPYVRGERAMRSYLVSFRAQGKDVWPEKYREYAGKVQMLERLRGREWEEVRLHLEEWPMSPGGYEYLRHDPFIKYTEVFDTVLHD